MRCAKVSVGDRTVYFPADSNITALLDVFEPWERLVLEWVELSAPIPWPGSNGTEKLAALLLRHKRVSVEDAAALLGMTRTDIYGAWRHVAERHIPDKYRLVIDKKVLRLVPNRNVKKKIRRSEYDVDDFT